MMPLRCQSILVLMIAIIAAVAPRAVHSQSIQANDPTLVAAVRNVEAGTVTYRVVPYDTITTRDGRRLFVETGWCERPSLPLEWRNRENLQVTPLGATGKQRLRTDDVTEVLYWEARVLDHVRQRIANDGGADALSALLTRLEQINAAWEPRERQTLELRLRLKAVRTRVAKRASAPGTLAAALADLETLARSHRGEPTLVVEYSAIHAELALEALSRGEHAITRDRLRDLERMAADAPATVNVRAAARRRARELLIDAEVAQRTGNAGAAAIALAAAASLGAGDAAIEAELRRQRKSETLLVGAFEPLPAGAPLPARTDLQRFVSGLAFERLFEPWSGATLSRTAGTTRGSSPPGAAAATAQRYVRGPLVEWAELKDNGTRVDVMLAEGRQFSDGQPLSAGLVQEAARMASRDGIKEVTLLGSRQLSFRLSTHPQPLELLALPVFAGPRIGTGPFQLEANPDPLLAARLVRNPTHPANSSPKNAPPVAGLVESIAIRRYTADQAARAASDLARGEIELLFPAFADDFADVSGGILRFPRRPIRRDSVWLLAINHRHPLWTHRDARRALLLALPRQAILQEVFPPNPQNARHQVATGPFPPHSPAHDDSVPETLMDVVAARDLIASLRMKHPEAFQKPLRLAFAVDEPRSSLAMEKVRGALEAVGISAQLMPLTIPAYLEQVLDNHEFELAYYRLDHDDSLCDLRGLFGIAPRELERGGHNFMGYQDDNLWQLMIDASRGRTGVEIHSRQRQIQRRLHDQIAFVPLWWLEQFAVSGSRLVQRDAAGHQRPAIVDGPELTSGAASWSLATPERVR
jgi:ABC-type transport system substrate-binding protein